MSSFAELQVKCETIEFNSNPIGQWTMKYPYAKLLSCKSIRKLVNMPESEGEREIPYPFAFRKVVLMKVLEFLDFFSSKYDANYQIDYSFKSDRFWENLQVKEFYDDFIDIPMSHPDHGLRSGNLSWTNSKGKTFTWANLPVVEDSNLKSRPDEDNIKGVTMFQPRDNDPVTITELMSAANKLECVPLYKVVINKFATVLKGKTIDGILNEFMIHETWKNELKNDKKYGEKILKERKKYFPLESDNLPVSSSKVADSASAAGGGN